MNSPHLLDPSTLDLDVTNWTRERDAARTKKIIADFRRRFREAGQFDVLPVKVRLVTDPDGNPLRKLVDGRCRVIAARDEGFKVLVEEVVLSEDDALDYGITANLGHSLNNKEKERAILLRLTHPTGVWRSRTPRWLADDLGVSAHTVKAVANRHCVQFAQTLVSRDGKQVENKVVLDAEPTPKTDVVPGDRTTVWAEVKWSAIPDRQNYVQVNIERTFDAKTGTPRVAFEFALDLRPVTPEIVAKEGRWHPTGAARFKLKGDKLIVSGEAEQVEPKLEPRPSPVPASDETCPSCGNTGEWPLRSDADWKAYSDRQQCRCGRRTDKQVGQTCAECDGTGNWPWEKRSKKDREDFPDPSTCWCKLPSTYDGGQPGQGAPRAAPSSKPRTVKTRTARAPVRPQAGTGGTPEPDSRRSSVLVGEVAPREGGLS